jgi:hypothetical protein
MDDNVLRVIRGAEVYDMTCNMSLDYLICVNDASFRGVNIVDPNTKEVFMLCPQLDFMEREAFPTSSHTTTLSLILAALPCPGCTRLCVWWMTTL